MPCPQPKQKESKQSYLRRCVSQCTGDGMDEGSAFAACTLEAQRLGLAVQNEMERVTGSVTLLAPESSSSDPADTKSAPEAESPRRFAILAYTGQTIDRWWGQMVLDLAGMTVPKNSIPALLNHETDKIVGHSLSHNMESTGLHIYGVFSRATDDAREVLALAEEGFPWQASIGVRPLAMTELKKGATMQVNGREVEGPIYVATQSVVEEISFCPLGADNNTAAIVMTAKENAMPDNTPQRAPGNEQLSSPPTASTAPPAAPATAPAPQSSPDQVQQAAQSAAQQAALQAMESERLRSREILRLCAAHGLQACAETWIEQGHDLDAVRALALEALAKKPGGAPMGRMDMGVAEGDKFRALAAEGIAMAHGLRVEKPQEGSRQFMGLGLQDMARLALERAGISVMGLSRQDVATQLLSPQIRLSSSTSDFTAVYMDVAGKKLLQAYAEAPRTYEPWTSRVTATDFKTMYGVTLSEAPNLQRVGENEEYTTGSLGDHAESYSIAKYGKILGISWEMIVNDDLNAFSRLPGMFGAAVARLYGDIVYSRITGNHVMSDGKGVFDVAHKNIVNPASGITNDGMNNSRLLMRMQTGLQGARLNLSPSFLLLPPSLENTALVLLRSAALPQEGMSSAVYNQWNDGSIRPIVEQRLEPDSPTAAKPWYLAASPTQVSTIDVAFLNGRDAPEITEDMSFRTDAINYKVRACVGAGVMDFRGLVKNPGVTG